MNFFEEQLRLIVGNQSAFDDAKYIGRACYANMDNEVKLKAEFITRMVADRYVALKLTAINQKDGTVDSLTLNFEDYFQNSDKSFGIDTPYIWKDGRDVKWCAEPSIKEKTALGDAVQDYAKQFIPQKSINISPLPQIKDILSIRFEDVHLVHKDEEHNLATIVELDENTLTKQGKEAWLDILNANVHRIYEGDYGLQIEVDGVDAERLFDFSYMLAGNCSTSDYDKWVSDAPDSQNFEMKI